jgi:predicted amino acid-binding ACT domain protein
VQVGSSLGLEATAFYEVGSPAAARAASDVVSVYGADHPGIVHAVSVAFAEWGCNVTDLLTRLLGEGETGFAYVVILEGALPDSLAPETLREDLGVVAREQDVEVAVHAARTRRPLRRPRREGG